MTEGEAETKRQKAIEFLRRIGNDDDADRFEDMTAADYAEHKGAELLDNPRRRKRTMPRGKNKAELEAELDEANDYIEQLESKLDDIAGIAADEDEEEEEPEDESGGRVAPPECGQTPSRLTDRARRYRAVKCVRPGPPVCHFCGIAEAELGEPLQIHHLSGREADGDPQNLIRVCRSCNQRADRVLKAHGLGVKTRQFNPTGEGAKSLGAWLTAVMTVTGQAPQMDLQKAIDLIHYTPAARRSEFAREVWRRRRRGGSGLELVRLLTGD